MARQQDNRRFGGERREQRAHRVGVAGPAGDHGDAGLAGEPPPGVRHVHGRRLVAHVHEVELRLQRRIEQRHDVVAGQREHVPAAETLERTGNDVGTSQAVVHRQSFPVGCALAAKFTNSVALAAAFGVTCPGLRPQIRGTRGDQASLES